MSRYYVDDRDAGELLKVEPWPIGWRLDQVDSGQWLVETDGTCPQQEGFVSDLSVPLRDPNPKYFEWH